MKKKLLDMLKNFITAFIIFPVFMYLYMVLSFELFSILTGLIVGGGLELYQWLYAKVKFNPYDVVARLAGCTLGFHTVFVILMKLGGKI